MLPWPGIDVTKTRHAAMPAIDPAVNSKNYFPDERSGCRSKDAMAIKNILRGRTGVSGSNPVPFRRG
jgi:hypothetical protein